VFYGPGTLFEGGVKLPDDCPDGQEQTLLFVEAGDPIPWTKPDEFLYDPDRPVELRGVFRNGLRARTALGPYRFIPHEADQRTLHALITRNGGETLPEDWWTFGRK
jgi:hypothetical protein